MFIRIKRKQKTGQATDELVKVAHYDTTPGWLNDKIDTSETIIKEVVGTAHENQKLAFHVNTEVIATLEYLMTTLESYVPTFGAAFDIDLNNKILKNFIRKKRQYVAPGNSVATLKPDYRYYDEYLINYLTTSFTLVNPDAGTQKTGDIMYLQITGNATLHTITKGTAFLEKSGFNWPTATVPNKIQTMIARYDENIVGWDLKHYSVGS